MLLKNAIICSTKKSNFVALPTYGVQLAQVSDEVFRSHGGMLGEENLRETQVPGTSIRKIKQNA